MMQPAKVCGKCSSGGSIGQMLGCDMCDVWFHAGCVDETDTNLNPDRTWKCSRCVKDDAGEVSSHHASKSVRSSASSRARRELLLQQLEEQRALKLKQRAEEDEIRRKRAEEDDAFLQQKLELMLDDDNESRRSKLSSRASRQKVEGWLNDGRGGQTVATGPTSDIVTPKQGEVHQPGLITSVGAAHLPECAPSTSGMQREVPTSTSTPQAGKTHKLVLVEDPRNGMPQHVGHLNYLGNSKGYCGGNSILPPSSLVGPNVGGQPFPLHASCQIAPVSELSENCIAKTTSAETKVTFSGYIPPFVPSVHQNTFGVNYQGVGTCQGQSVKPPVSRSTIIPPFVGASVIAPEVFPSVTVQNANVPVLPSSTSVPNIDAEQRASAVSAVESFGGASAAELQPNPAGVQQFGGPQVGISFQPVPSSAQLAARQVMPRELPNFSGDPQDWPLFSSSFYNSTTACGFTDAENLARLQRCLKGHALDSVKSRLLMPESVPHVMETLRKLYGRPEVLIHTLLRRLRSVPPPRTENLQSVITFGMAVRNLVDHMFVAQLMDHLRNPMLLHELVEKLPSSMKMQWSWYKRLQAEVNLATFGEFMTEMVNTASDVTLPTTDAAVHQARPNQAGKENQKLYVHAETRGERGGLNCTPGPAGTRRPCHYCSDEEHEVVTCPQFKSLDVYGRWKAMRLKGLCRTCLIPHRKWPCRSGRECGVEGCRMRHHELLHSRDAIDSSAGQAGSERRSGPSGASVIQQNHHLALNFCLFRYLPVTLEGNGKQVETFAFLDDGCQTTLMEAGLAEDLDIAGPAESLWLGWTGNISREEKGSQRLSVKISGDGMKNQYKLSNVRTVQRLQLQGQTFHYEELMKMYPHLRGLSLRSYVNAVPRIIIGIEHAQLLTALKVREGKSNDPVAVKTRLGWCVYGKQTSGGSSAIERVHLHTEEQQIGNRELHDLMKQYFAIEEAAVATPIESAEDSRARAILQKTTRRIEGGFETGLIWKYDHPVFPDSFPLALRRLQSLEKRLAKDQELGEKVSSLIRDYETKGYAHKITQEELESTDPSRVWYLPLGVVRNPKKPEKVRLIWDAAAREHRLSFNDMLLKGPDMMTSLVAVLLRFRQRSIAICGDIREMFHQVRIIPEDKQSQRFLFRCHPDDPPQIYVMDVATFGASCSPCSSQFVKNKNAQEFASQFPRASEAIIKAHYVDDYLDSVDTVEEAVQLVNEVKYVHALGGFEIRNFSSNSSAVLQSLGETERSPKSLDLEGSVYVERVLGMVWKPAEDLFSFDVTVKDDLKNFLEGNTVPTKRQVLRLVMSLFDPCGFIAHYIVHGKILMQHIWRSGTDWDDGISLEVQGMWRNWILLLERLAEVKVPRCLFGETSSKEPATIQLHVFVDASELAYACCAYLRIVQAGVIRCCLVAAKTKVAPLKPLSIPRLELQACVIGCRLMETVCVTLDLTIEGRYLWTDSATALAWIKSDSRRYHPYVAFRVGEILNSSSVDEWFHVPSKQNVADDATKWGSGPNFSPNNRWFAGESFLYEPMTKWPKQTGLQWKTNEELRAAFHLHQELPESTIDVSKFSNWSRLLRATAYVQRAAQNFRGRKIGGELTSDELLRAENLLWRQTQQQAYPDEYSVLKHNLEHPEKTPKLLEKSSSLFQESPLMDSAGVIRMNSRISTAPSAPFATKYPVILPKDHALTRLLVDSYHRRFLHMHNETVFNEVRQRFRIPQLRPVIKRVARECQRCRITKSVPQAPMMSPLPAVRLTPNVRAFSYTGVDYFGPIMVKQGRSLVKRWVALFTCLTIRAVHLEVVHSLSMKSCVMAIRRFVSRRGAPKPFTLTTGRALKVPAICLQIS
ncbi:uncharacterized protein LOC109426713 [Aedes albopictus]|uniref:PHD-type domain-containing protein n=1 Tax=Aedes albopictus TaxID=7160 RepID=A0ABM1XLZ3_AEDAL